MLHELLQLLEWHLLPEVLIDAQEQDDVEGFELEVLHGAAECLRKAKRLVLEYHTEALRAACLEVLQPRFEIRTAGSLIFAEVRPELAA